MAEPSPDRRSAPRVFISHSSLDKVAYANPLVELLRAEGVDPWIDSDDIPLGDDFVVSIFKGIRDISAFVVIVTENIERSAYVPEEISNAAVRRIHDRSRIVIPILVKGAEPPDPFIALNPIHISFPADLPGAAKRIADRLFNRKEAVTIAPPPAYAGAPLHMLPNLQPTDVRVFVMLCEQLLQPEVQTDIWDLSLLLKRGDEVGLGLDAVNIALQALEGAGYVDNLITEQGTIMPLGGHLTYAGLEEYLSHYESNQYRDAKAAALHVLLNKPAIYVDAIAAATGFPLLIIEHIIEGLRRARAIDVSDDGYSVRPRATLERIAAEFEGPKPGAGP